ncbi:hypothetical protein [Massilia sp. DWR3-1-1]|uniref:hypothetical protein n=1 Tax=Massilia sp. DWR3-1-1 TaxID=2804559 RepID=UPI003CF16D65
MMSSDLIAIVFGGLLSLAMETLRQFKPSRTASFSALAMNVLGTLAGAMLVTLLRPQSQSARTSRNVRR